MSATLLVRNGSTTEARPPAELFWATMAGMVLIGLALLMYFRRKGYL